MGQSPQTIQVSRDGILRDATLSWCSDWQRKDDPWLVRLVCAGFGAAEARATDAFEALCMIRDEVEPFGWRVGVAGAQANVWPSGMARDQGGGLRAYRLTAESVEDLVDTFAPVDPATVTTVTEQRAETQRLFEEIRRRAEVG